MSSGTAPNAPSSYTVSVPPWTTHRTLAPIRAAALHEAVEAWLQTPRIADDATGSYDPINEILEVAERFERWLASTDEVAT